MKCGEASAPACRRRCGVPLTSPRCAQHDLDMFERMFEGARLQREEKQTRLNASAGESRPLGMDESGAPLAVKPGVHSWTQASPFEKDLFKYTPSDKIGSHYTPAAANATLNERGAVKIRKASTGVAAMSPIPRPPPAGRMPGQPQRPPSPQTQQAEALSRYYHSINGLEDTGITPIRDAWLETVMSTIPSELLHDDMSVNEALQYDLEAEIADDYMYSMRKVCLRGAT